MNPGESLLVEAEHFDDPGGWTLDTEFVESMGSPYLMAHGLGQPVANAVTSLVVPVCGQWRVWVRTIDWVARWRAPGTPGRFQLSVNGSNLPVEFGTRGAEWNWQDGGVVDIPERNVTLGLHDLTGFNGRCDAIYLTRRLDADPPPTDPDALSEWRRNLSDTDRETNGGHFDLVVVGGGYAGMCAALTSARAGLKTALIQDRPVLGGNASSEIRVPLRGLIPEQRPWRAIGSAVETLQYDPSPNARTPEARDDARYASILDETQNLSLFLNHRLESTRMEGTRITGIHARDVRKGTCLFLTGNLFADCTGHATLGAMAGAECMMGDRQECDFRPSRESPLMGTTNMWFWEVTDSPHRFSETPWALDLAMHDVPTFNLTQAWSWESGFFRHPIRDLEYIRDWNLRAIFGIWNAMKNKDESGRYANARITHLAAIGGARESRRLRGDYLLDENDMLRRVEFPDGFVPVSWYLDRHFPVRESLDAYPDDPFLGKGQHKPGTRREDRPRHDAPWWGIPYRCLYSRTIENLFMAGRNISTTYWALGAVRVMRTCGMMGEVVGNAAAVCAEKQCNPRDVYQRFLSALARRLTGPSERACAANEKSPHNPGSAKLVYRSRMLRPHSIRSSMTTTQTDRQWHSELTITKDSVSGATVRQLTNYRAHSNHAYFTYPCWYDNGRKLVIASDRDNRANLFGVDIESGALTQLTDWDSDKLTNRHSLSKNPVRDEIAFTYDGAVQVLDLATLETRRLLDCPKGYTGNLADFTADGRFLVTGFSQDLSDRFQVDLLNGYIGFNEIWAAKPHSTVWKIPLVGGTPELIHEEYYWLGHFNASPTLPNIMTFCHEGPWNKVDNRIWGLDIETGRAWKIRPTAPGETVGHEYWMSDGEHIGYHGGNAQGGRYGSIRYDNTDHVEASFSGHCWHFHSHMLDLVVGDGNAQEPYLLVWRFRDGAFQGPKVLAWHRGSFHAQQLHVHPCVHAGGTKVLYTADPQAYGQVFIVDVPEWDAMPDRTTVTKNKEV